MKIIVPQDYPDPIKWKEAIELMINNGSWHFAQEFLTSVYDQIGDKGLLTEAQVRALRKIRDSKRNKAMELGIENA